MSLWWRLLCLLALIAPCRATETWLLALGEKEDEPAWGIVRIVPPPFWENLKLGGGGITRRGLLTLFPPMFGNVAVTLAPVIDDRAKEENEAVEIPVPPKRFRDVLETILSQFDVMDAEPKLIGTIQVLLSTMGAAGLRNISEVTCVRVALSRGGRKKEMLSLMNVLREHTRVSLKDPIPDKIPEDAGDVAIAAYWRTVLLKRAAEHIEGVHSFAARGFLIFEVKDGASAEFEGKVFYLGNPF